MYIILTARDEINTLHCNSMRASFYLQLKPNKFYFASQACKGKWGKVERTFQVSPMVCILQIWLFLCIKLIFGVNTFKKNNIHFTFK